MNSVFDTCRLQSSVNEILQKRT